jgi:CheY-like chemotaxis protein
MQRILIVDDDDGVRIIVAKHLTDLGYAIAFAANGWEALLSLEKDRADLIILDGMMPGMDGFTLLRILRSDRRRKDIPVIMVTSRDPAEVKSLMGEQQVTAMLHKADKDFLPKLAVAVGRILPR